MIAPVTQRRDTKKNVQPLIFQNCPFHPFQTKAWKKQYFAQKVKAANQNFNGKLSAISRVFQQYLKEAPVSMQRHICISYLSLPIYLESS